MLLDENLPIKLKNYFSDIHIVTTVRDEKWSGIKNGTLLDLMQQHNFDALITKAKIFLINTI